MLAVYLSMIDNEKDRSKFESVYLKYRNLMLNRAYDILKDSELAEDAVHNAFLRILKNLSKIDKADDLKTRLFVTVIIDNVAKTMYNKEHKVILTELTDIDAKINIEEIIEDRDAVQHIMEAVGSLPETYSYVIFLKYFNKFSDKEIASALDISVSAVRKRLLRGKKRLVDLLRRGESDE